MKKVNRTFTLIIGIIVVLGIITLAGIHIFFNDGHITDHTVTIVAGLMSAISTLGAVIITNSQAYEQLEISNKQAEISNRQIEQAKIRIELDDNKNLLNILQRLSFQVSKLEIANSLKDGREYFCNKILSILNEIDKYSDILSEVKIDENNALNNLRLKICDIKPYVEEDLNKYTDEDIIYIINNYCLGIQFIEKRVKENLEKLYKEYKEI